MNRPQTDTARITQEQIDEIVRRLIEAIAPQRIYLFGSYAYGDPGPDSDVDLMIIVDAETVQSVDFLKRAYRCLRGSFLAIELHFQSEDCLNRRSTVPTSLEYDVVTKGHLLYAA